ncbi:hypothetical protein JOB18_031634 [Solea senegalensis]|uniref:AATF protein n=1 Tax=Solea senegalensis TaxID=28829 RepID=A0AAV6SBN7_SOLSE|nr:protein AATF [Solea senegalensis]XP_043899141.1 protein AATF [Solea senegalensis]KAG7514367.1 AATF protein [Solea senegalensis]KAG7514368.1 hypothetical protein JOB18_031634 [Solea senegalensis]KAG7514369.1 hypothetical protein JOB18_031634 [Solea senegalensis]KAG7514370.1 hypothetical protein JOB18_031634 [Solea senegalensis]KAG7514371.1 hypothetical protein JOB18_031634 [Solea senegalensis]
MAASFSQQLEDLLNPLPKFVDPEDGDEDETTKARVVEKFNDEDEDDDDEGGLGRSSLRKNNATLLSDTDRRYVGKTVSRKQLEEEDDDDDEGEEEEDEEEEGSIEELEEGEEEEVDGIDVDDEEEAGLKVCDTTFPEGVDFHKLTEGMDDLGVSEDDDDDDDDDDDNDDETEDSDEEGDGDEMVDEDGEEVVRTFSKEKVDEEVAKGRAVKNQLVLWDQLLEGRIKMQKALVTANQLPQPQMLPEFKKRGGAELAAPLKNAHKALKALQRTLLELQDELLCQNSDTRAVALGDTDATGEDEDIDSDEDKEEEETVKDVRPPKRKLEMTEYPDFMAKRFAAFQPYQNTTLQKWHDKTRLTTGKSSKGFGAFDRNILTQVEQVLMDKERLLRRTQTRRSEYRTLGKKEVSPLETVPAEDGDTAQPQLKANTHLKELDEDIFDDDDFYHQLLRELIERKTSAADPNDQVAMGRQWLAIQKLRSKIKKKVDTKASKGRKVRFHVHSKLVNFMAPVDHSAMDDEARSELYRGLFGRNSAVRE